jgi:hypothetical protein
VKSPYSKVPRKAFWRAGVVDTDKSLWPELIEPKFAISSDTAIATAGSCFAQHIGRVLKDQGMNVLDAEPAPSSLSSAQAQRSGYGIYSARYGNIYTPRQLRELLEDMSQQTVHPSLFWEKGDRFYDALRPGTEPDGYSSLVEAMGARQLHLARVAQLFASSDVLVFTPGLTEGWIDTNVDRVLALAPGVIAGTYDTERYTFHNFTYDELCADLEAIHRGLRAINPKIKLLLTVSPVPLTATASGEHVLTATTYSKSALRAAVGHMSQTYTSVDYFPSYELVTTWAQNISAFEENLRSVRPEMVAQVMSVFLRAYGISPTDDSAMAAP